MPNFGGALVDEQIQLPVDYFRQTVADGWAPRVRGDSDGVDDMPIAAFCRGSQP